jgi:hypothetical protein
LQPVEWGLGQSSDSALALLMSGLRHEQQLADHGTTLQHFVRSRRLAKGQASVYARMELSVREHIDEGAHAGAALFNEMIPRMDGELPNRGRVPAQARRWQEIELRPSAQRAVYEQRSARGKHFDIFGKGRPSHRIDDGLDAATARNLVDAFADLNLFAIDNVICTQITDKAFLLFAAHHTNHCQIRRLCQVDQRIAHTTGGGKDNYCLSLPKAQSIVEDVISDLDPDALAKLRAKYDTVQLATLTPG